MLSNFVALDFEFLTIPANIIQIGYVVVRNGEIVQTFEQLVKPPCSRYEFYSSPAVSKITGITYDILQDAPTFEEVWPDLYKAIHNKIVVAHNAVSADLSILSKELVRTGFVDCEYSNISFDCYCTMNIARNLGHPKCGLSELCDCYNIELTSHHKACSDAEATAKLFIALAEQNNIREFTPVTFNSRYVLDKYGDFNYQAKREPYFLKRNREEREKRRIKIDEIQTKLEKAIDDPKFFCDEVVVITGLTYEDKEQLASRLIDAGAIIKNTVTKCTTYVIAGENAGWSKLGKAKEFNIPVVNIDDIVF